MATMREIGQRACRNGLHRSKTNASMLVELSVFSYTPIAIDAGACGGHISSVNTIWK